MSVDTVAYMGIASIAVGPDGTAYIAYDRGVFDEWDDIQSMGVGLAMCNSGGCSTSTIAGGISPSDVIWAVIGIGPGGNPAVQLELGAPRRLGISNENHPF